MRAHAHPALLTALKRIKNYEGFIEKHSPTVKQSGFFFFDNVGLARPEIVHYRERLNARYTPPENPNVLVLIPQTRDKPFHRSEGFKDSRRVINRLSEAKAELVHVCFYAAPFGVVPLELDEVYPLSQHETALPLDCEVKDYVATQVADYVKRSSYQAVVLINDPNTWDNTVKQQCRAACKKRGAAFELLTLGAQGTKEFLTRLETILKKNLGDSA
jgi:7-cyano-7-deazaguanine tRNA-ribosyltransferase